MLSANYICCLPTDSNVLQNNIIMEANIGGVTVAQWWRVRLEIEGSLEEWQWLSDGGLDLRLKGHWRSDSGSVMEG